MTETETNVTVKLVYQGVRTNAKGTLIHVFCLADNFDETRVFTKLKGTVVGGYYEVEAKDGNATSVYPTTAFWTGDRIEDEALRARWQIEARDALNKDQRRKAEKRLSGSPDLDEAVEGVLTLAGQLRTGHELSVFRNIVSDRITEAYFRKN